MGRGGAFAAPRAFALAVSWLLQRLGAPLLMSAQEFVRLGTLFP